MSVADAVLALAKAAVAPVAVYDGKVPPGATGRYVVLYDRTPRRWSEDVANSNDLRTFRFQLTYVGLGIFADRAAVADLVEKCQDALIGTTPVVSGLALGPISQEGDSRPFTPDKDDPSGVALTTSDSFVLLGSRA